MSFFAWKLGRLAWGPTTDGGHQDEDGDWTRIAGHLWWLYGPRKP
jgi:hypothetical protein